MGRGVGGDRILFVLWLKRSSTPFEKEGDEIADISIGGSESGSCK